MTRPYVRYTQGLLKNMMVSNQTYNFFEASYKADTDIKAPTEVYINTEYWFS